MIACSHSMAGRDTGSGEYTTRDGSAPSPVNANDAGSLSQEIQADVQAEEEGEPISVGEAISGLSALRCSAPSPSTDSRTESHPSQASG